MTASLPLPDAGPVPGSSRAGASGAVPARAVETSPEHPWPVRLLAHNIESYVARMPALWVEGQVVQLSRRGGGMAFLTLRDTDQDMSVPVAALSRVVQRVPVPLEEGAHVVVHARPEYWAKRGSLQLKASEIRPVGVGELLARIERLKSVLAAEGVFDASRKVALPFLPAVVGLVCGRGSKAEHDVVVNARERWPQVRFEIREVAVQGVDAVGQVSAAIADLDARPDVEVIVVARGGGAVEDLLPFSNETLVRAAAACRTPLVSAIGHETDCPLLDLVADHRASTPTDAAKRIVPDVSEERARVVQSRDRIRSAVAALVAREQAGLDAARSRPVLAAPHVLVDAHAEQVVSARDRGRRALDARLLRAAGEVDRLEAQVRALSPASTLERGYAVVQRGDGHVVRTPDDVATDDALHVRVAGGAFDVTVLASTAR
ncbi:exodeoxyribonuclease VII large subunit [Cellulosimicrobium arenosum]|uniref:exodeoxyribonuclease VII large subunit n=1 Tax=Cellulosimicrobium arenosum TaxID=2708133 RepID=UPI003BA84BA7